MTLAALSETPLELTDLLIICMLEVLVFVEQNLLWSDLMEEALFLLPLKQQVGDLSGGVITWETIHEFPHLYNQVALPLVLVYFLKNSVDG